MMSIIAWGRRLLRRWAWPTADPVVDALIRQRGIAPVGGHGRTRWTTFEPQLCEESARRHARADRKRAAAARAETQPKRKPEMRPAVPFPNRRTCG